MHLDQLNGLLALKAVADTRNFSAAARLFGVSPSAVSQTIKQLEQRLGIALLSRTTRSTSLTEAGEVFLSQAGPALDHILAALEDVGTYAEKPSGLLRLNLPRQVYPSYIAPLLASFAKKHPEVTVELFFEDQVTDIVGKGFDAGIRLSDILAKDPQTLRPHTLRHRRLSCLPETQRGGLNIPKICCCTTAYVHAWEQAFTTDGSSRTRARNSKCRSKGLSS